MSDPRIGTVLDRRYKIIEQIASGGMGSVYRAERVKLGRTVAIKFLHTWSASHKKARQRFDLEAKAMAKLDHPNCASVIDFGVVDSVPYVVMEFVSGENLRDVLDRGRLGLDRSLEIIRQVLLGLAHAHERGIIHRDIKPANVMVGEATGVGIQVKLLDFGLARLMGAGDTRVTAEGRVLGTPAYMAPEQTRAGGIDARSDIYACGVLLFEMLTGHKPFDGDDAVEILQKQRQADPPRLSALVPQDFGALEHVVARAMHKDPDQRYQTAAEFASAIVRARHSVTYGYPTNGVLDATARVPRSLNAKHAVALGLALLLLIGVVVAAATSGNPGAPVTVRDAAQPADSGVAADADTQDPLSNQPQHPGIAEAIKLMKAGDKDQAIEQLQEVENKHPEFAQASYLLGRLYFDKFWTKNGLPAYRRAIVMEPRYRTHKPLIRSVLHAYVISRDEREELADFLYEEIGEPAIPLIEEEIAREHSRKRARKRAVDLLERFKQGSGDPPPR